MAKIKRALMHACMHEGMQVTVIVFQVGLGGESAAFPLKVLNLKMRKGSEQSVVTRYGADGHPIGCRG